MMKDLSALKSAMKESPNKSTVAFAGARKSMDTWLDGVELPRIGDKAYDPRSLPLSLIHI